MLLKTRMAFGESLKYLLYTIDMSISRLSKAINVDCSLVNRWVNGKRIPSYNTHYIEGISEYLAKNIFNTFQDERIDSLFLNLCENSEAEISMKEKIKKILLESQGYSIECKKAERKEAKNHSTAKEQISIFLNGDKHCFHEDDNINNENHMWNTYNFDNSVSLSVEDKIIFGTENLIAASISLFEAAAGQECKYNSTIYITYNNEVNIEKSPYNHLIQLKNALLKAMNNGWKVIFLLRINNNTDRTIKFINFAKPLIKTGKFIPYYVEKYDSFATGKEIVVVPGIGVLSCFSTNGCLGMNCGFYLKNKTAVDIFNGHFNVLLKNCSQPLIKNYINKNNKNYGYCLAKSEEGIGNRFLHKYCFSILTLPEHLYKKLLKKKRISNDEKQIALELYKRRLNAFLSNIQNYEYKDIYYADSIRELIMHQQFDFYNYTGIEHVKFEVQDIIEFLQNIIYLLKTYDKYYIAFMPTKNSRTIKNDSFYCVVKERQAVLLETFKPLKCMPEMQLSIEEPMLVRAFEEYFRKIWEHIAPINRDKSSVISWLQSQINILENNY